jgi:hypothetical protein
MKSKAASRTLRGLKEQNRTRVARHRARLAERGVVQVTLTIPAEARQPLQGIARRLRAGEVLAGLLPGRQSDSPDRAGSQRETRLIAELRARTERQGREIARLEAEIAALKTELDRVRELIRQQSPHQIDIKGLPRWLAQLVTRYQR